ncbi:hypothetical protein BN938_0300 [Mucinivorans hirudinis]|uniref:Uncharacterized protein n=1 Tax=Mucinivorans hirudinis TaxID=1433126 RepID=A0A060R620_9BACT|nr:hypothetical protein BN938_0300 [Mucinivorans hirudinis]
MDYYREYLDTLDDILSEFVSQKERFMLLGKTSANKAVKNTLWSKLILDGTREYYNKCRKQGVSVSELKSEILLLLSQKYGIADDDTAKLIHNDDFTNYDFLRQYKGTIVVFCMNARQIDLWIPIISQNDSSVLMLCNFDTEKSIFADGNFTVLELSFLSDRYIHNSYLERCFTAVFEYANLFTMLINVLKPQQVMVMEGCHFETEILAAVCRPQSIETVCYQQGWPSVMHTRFRDMGYDRFITWGEEFNELWRRYNPAVKFETGCYPYSICKCKIGNAVTFFLQAPIIISDDDYFDQLLQLARYIAIQHSNVIVLIREHPEYRLRTEQKLKFEQMNNVEFVSDIPLYEVFERTLISVSIFSSTIIESLVHNSIPFVLDPTTDGCYYPLVDDWGVEVHSLESAKEKLAELIKDKTLQNKMFRGIEKWRPVYFYITDRQKKLYKK